jgi:hypothetical protein
MLVEITVMSFRVSLESDVVVEEVNNMWNENEIDKHEQVWCQLGVHEIDNKLIVNLRF